MVPKSTALVRQNLRLNRTAIAPQGFPACPRSTDSLATGLTDGFSDTGLNLETMYKYQASPRAAVGRRNCKRRCAGNGSGCGACGTAYLQVASSEGCESRQPKAELDSALALESQNAKRVSSELERRLKAPTPPFAPDQRQFSRLPRREP